MPSEERQEGFPCIPMLRGAYGKDINKQEYCRLAGISDLEPVESRPGIVRGFSSNNWGSLGVVDKKKKQNAICSPAGGHFLVKAGNRCAGGEYRTCQGGMKSHAICHPIH